MPLILKTVGVDVHLSALWEKATFSKRPGMSAAENAISTLGIHIGQESRQFTPKYEEIVTKWLWLTQHVGGHAQQGVQQIVDFSVSLHDVGELLIVHKLHVSSRVRSHMLTIKGS